MYVEELGLMRARVLVAPGAPDSTAVEPAGADEDSTRAWSIVADRVRVRDSTLDAPGNVHLHDVDVTGGGELDGYRADVRASGSVWRFADVRGIRIEDDVLVTEAGCELLSGALPSDSRTLEQLARA